MQYNDYKYNAYIKIFDLCNYEVNYSNSFFVKYNNLINGGINNVKNYCCN